MESTKFFANKAAPKIVSIWGSQRVGSFNKMLHDHAVKVMEANGAIVTSVDLGALNLPLYSPELEGKKFPVNAQKFKDSLIDAGTSISSSLAK